MSLQGQGAWIRYRSTTPRSRLPVDSAKASRAPDAVLISAGSFVVMKTSSRGTPLSRTASPTLASLP
jgi:hypothetical protein